MISNKLLLIVNMLCLSHISIEASFAKTAAEERAEIVALLRQENAPAPLIEQIEKGTTDDVIKKWPATVSMQSLLANEKFKTEYPEAWQHIQALYDVSIVVKRQMDIPADVELYFNFCQDADGKPATDIPGAASYVHINRRIYIFGNIFFEKAPAMRLFLLAHEFQHAKQHQQSGIVKYMRHIFENLPAIERDADLGAAATISCPRCLQFMAAYRKFDKADHLGYLSSEELFKLAEAKSEDHLCIAHKAATPENDTLRALIHDQEPATKEKCIALQALDHQVGQSLQDRLLKQ